MSRSPDLGYLYFEHRECLDDCGPGYFACDFGHSPEFFLTGFGGRELGKWLLHDSVVHGTEAPQLVVSFDGERRAYTVDETKLSEDTGLFSVHGGTGGDFARLFGTAADIRLITPSREFLLPSTPADMANRIAFAAACSQPPGG